MDSKHRATDGHEYHQIQDHPNIVFTAGCDSADRSSARKIHKADREKLRRDRLNEQFAVLALVLDPSRPKNDRATILEDVVKRVRDLRSEVRRLKLEQISLLNESHELALDKTELSQEKAILKTETQRLRLQLQQNLLSWLPFTAAIMKNEPAFSHVVAFQQPKLIPERTIRENQQVADVDIPVGQCVHIPAQIGTLCLRSPMLAYVLHRNKHPTGSENFQIAPTVGSHYRVERPQAQYPAHQHHISDILVRLQPCAPLPYFSAQTSLVMDVQSAAGAFHKPSLSPSCDQSNSLEE
ncbi:hypothetical protein O6H91_14G029600 [Diphasiastrum complanatum]|nr:hypothetical protein O6H91_14G029600 [Diphasiastrum complanatum]